MAPFASSCCFRLALEEDGGWMMLLPGHAGAARANVCILDRPLDPRPCPAPGPTGCWIFFEGLKSSAHPRKHCSAWSGRRRCTSVHRAAAPQRQRCQTDRPNPTDPNSTLVHWGALVVLVLVAGPVQAMTPWAHPKDTTSPYGTVGSQKHLPVITGVEVSGFPCACIPQPGVEISGGCLSYRRPGRSGVEVPEIYGTICIYVYWSVKFVVAVLVLISITVYFLCMAWYCVLHQTCEYTYNFSI